MAKLFRVLGKPQPAQGQFTPRHALLLVDRLLREMSAFAHSLLIRILVRILGVHGARSDLRTPPLCPLVDIRSTAIGEKGSPAAGPACQLIPARAAQVPRIWLRQWNNEKLRGVSRMRSRDQAMDKEDADVRRRIRAGVRESPRTGAINGGDDRGTPAPPRRSAVYVDEAIWEWRGLKWAHLLADDTDDLHRFAAALGIHRTSYQGPPRTSVPHYDLTSYERRRAIAHGAIASGRDEIVAVVRRLRSPCAARGPETGS